MKNKLIVFFGAPGVGKGTQAKIISKKLQIPHISTGDILREAIKEKTELGLKAKVMIDKGNLVQDDIMISLVEDVLNSAQCKNGFILDGFPRTLQQAKIFQQLLKEIFYGYLIIITLEADDKIIVNRLAQRRMCTTCHSIVNLNFLKDSAKCPTCGSKNSLVKRKDDEVEVIKKRLDIFHKTTKPVFDYYQKHAIVHKVNATIPVEEITKEILKLLT